MQGTTHFQFNRGKTIQINEERCKEIERENKILLDKMHEVHTRKSAIDQGYEKNSSKSPEKKSNPTL